MTYDDHIEARTKAHMNEDEPEWVSLYKDTDTTLPDAGTPEQAVNYIDWVIRDLEDTKQMIMGVA